MAEKEVTIFIIDLASSMGEVNGGRSVSDLNWSMRFVWDKLGDIVAANRKTLCVGIVGVNTDGTFNQLTDEEGYDNISVLRPIGPMSMADLHNLSSSIRPSSCSEADPISAIVVAMGLISDHVKKQKWRRKIYLITDGKSPLDEDGLEEIGEQLTQQEVELVILGVDFDAPEYGYKEEDKLPYKKHNEATLRKLTEHCDNAIFATMAEALEDIQTPRSRSVRPYKAYDGWLTIGDPETSPDAVNILVDRYFKTKLARPPAASTVVVKAEGESSQTQSFAWPGGNGMEGVEYSAVRQARTYKVNDPNAPGGKRDVEFESLARGYEYGRTAVHISESEHNITEIKGLKKSFKIVGFISKESFDPVLSMGEVCATIANKGHSTSELAFTSLVAALWVLETYAVARIVAKDNKNPQLVVLVPVLDPEPTLLDMPLPFSEDVRSYQFAPLDTVGRQKLTTHRLLPSDELNRAMSDYVDAMDLSTYQTDEEGKPVDYVPTEDVYNPAIHRIQQAVKYRAMHPAEPLPDMAPVLMKFSSPPEDLVARVQSQIDNLISAADVKKVPPKAKGRRLKESAKPLSGLDVDALLGQQKRDRISPENAIPDFKRALAGADQMPEVQDAAKQMDAIVRGLITDSFGDNHYDQALECIRVMREELTNLDEPELYNDFATSLKDGLLAGELGGYRRDFWFHLRHAKLGLVDKEQSELSGVTAVEAEEFLQV